MEIACPHCAQPIELESETLAALAGSAGFACPSCAGEVPLPRVPRVVSQPRPLAPVGGQRGSPAQPQAGAAGHGATLLLAHRGLNRNLVILGTLALLLLGGLGIWLATRNSGNTFNTKKEITNQVIHNSYFTQLIASGATTEKDLEAVTEIRPYKAGFIGITKEAFSWAEAEAQAKRVGAGVVAIEDGSVGTRQELLTFLSTALGSQLVSPAWVRERGEAAVFDGRDTRAGTVSEPKHRAILHWRPLGLGEIAAVREIGLDTLKPISANYDHGLFVVNYYSKEDSIRRDRVLVAGKYCEHFLYTHADCEAVFAVPPGFTRFSAVGIGPSGNRLLSWSYQLKADGKSIFQSKALTAYPNHEVRMEVDLPPETKTLTLITDKMGNNFADHAIWAYPKFLSALPKTEEAARAEAKRRYPDFDKPGSQLQIAFAAKVKLYQKDKPDFFRDPGWPLTLVDEIGEESPSILANLVVPTNAKASASYSNPTGTLAALNDGSEPKSSHDALPRFSFAPRLLTLEWVEYEFPMMQPVAGCAVYWGSDSPKTEGAKSDGHLGAPGSWKVLYKNAAGDWLPAEGKPAEPALDEWNYCQFKPVQAKALRLAVHHDSRFSSAILEWRLIPASAPVPENSSSTPAEIWLDDLLPTKAKVGALAYRANRYASAEENAGVRIQVNRKNCTHYLVAHADSEVSFAIPTGIRRFSAVGIAPSNRANPTWSYEVLVDGKSMFKSKLLNSYPEHQVKFDIAFPIGARTLTLITDSAGDARDDISIWAEPKLYRGK